MIKQHLNEACFERLRVYLEHKLERYGNKDSHFVASLFAKIWHLSNVKCSNHSSVCFLHSWWRIAFTRSISKHICVHRRAFACSHLTFSCFLNTQRSRNCSPEGQVLRVPYCQIYRAQNWCRWSRATNVYTKKNWLSILLAAWKNKRSTAKYSALKKLSMFTRTVWLLPWYTLNTFYQMRCRNVIFSTFSQYSICGEYQQVFALHILSCFDTVKLYMKMSFGEIFEQTIVLVTDSYDL